MENLSKLRRDSTLVPIVFGEPSERNPRYASETESLMTFSGKVGKAGPKPGEKADRVVYRDTKPKQHSIFLPTPR